MILITGATGFVGRSVLKKVLEKGYQVRCLARHAPPNHAKDASRVQWVAGDVGDLGSLKKAMEGIRKVIHLVGIIVPQGNITFEVVHAQGTHNMVEAAKKAGVQKFVHMSALGTSAAAESQYHQTKWKGEVYVRYSGLTYTIFRPSIIFGPGDQFLNMFARMIRFSPVIPLVGGGVNRLQPIWVEDVASFFALALDNPISDNKVYELGGRKDYSMRELMQILMDTLGKTRPMISIPMPLMRMQAAWMEMLLPKPPLTRDQLLMMKMPNTCDPGPAARDFGIQLSELEPKLRTYLGRN